VKAHTNNTHPKDNCVLQVLARPFEWLHNFRMDAVYVVLASKVGQTELWAITGTPGKALAAVRDYLPSGWLLTLTGECLPPEQAAPLGIVPGEPRCLTGEFHDASLKSAFASVASALAKPVDPVK
jgi:hypothetical protein